MHPSAINSCCFYNQPAETNLLCLRRALKGEKFASCSRNSNLHNPRRFSKVSFRSKNAGGNVLGIGLIPWFSLIAVAPGRAAAATSEAGAGWGRGNIRDTVKIERDVMRARQGRSYRRVSRRTASTFRVELNALTTVVKDA